MYPIIKNFLFKKDPEEAHFWAMRNLKKWSNNFFTRGFVKNLFTFDDSHLHRELWGLHFKNPVGLAAGFDKDAKYIDELSLLGFGFIEIGTLTPKPQAGNEAPRLFRLTEDEALLNHMGFNNEGVDAAVERLKKRKSDIIIGGNIGKNKLTPNNKAVEDYEYCFRKLYGFVDYFVVNVSSPNTPDLRELQEKEPLAQILSRLQVVNTQLGKARPIFLKIAPDISENQLDDIIEIALNLNINGIVATNTTIAREGLKSDENLIAKDGGISGKPLAKSSTEIIRYIHQKSEGKLLIIGVGGIFTTQDAKEKLEAGASLLQVYTGFIYEGPRIIKKVAEAFQKFDKSLF